MTDFSSQIHLLLVAVPALWLLGLSLLTALGSQLMMLYLDYRIDREVNEARSTVPDIDPSHVAIELREEREIWRHIRRISAYVAALALTAWLLGMGEWRYP